MIESYNLPANEKGNEIMFVFSNGVASFVEFKNEDKNLKPDGAKGWFCEFSSAFATSRARAELTCLQSLAARS